jgi:hypothetical protein
MVCDGHQTPKLIIGNVEPISLSLILIDSGSSHTFLNEKMRPQLQGVLVRPCSLRVQVVMVRLSTANIL